MKIFILFWAVMIFASIAWYGFLIFYIGIKGGWEIRRMTKSLGERKPDAAEHDS
jgi:hypothetical protein